MRPLVSLLRSCFSAKTTFVFYQSNAIMVCNKVLKEPQRRRVQRHLRCDRGHPNNRTPPGSLSSTIHFHTFASQRGVTHVSLTLTQVPGEPMGGWGGWALQSAGVDRRGKSRWRGKKKSLVHRRKEIKEMETHSRIRRQRASSNHPEKLKQKENTTSVSQTTIVFTASVRSLCETQAMPIR